MLFLTRLVDVGHAGVQVTTSQPSLMGALQHLVRGTNEVLVNTVTSAPSSRKASLDATVIANVTQSTNVSSENLEPSDTESMDKLESDKLNHVDSPAVVNGPGLDTVDKTECLSTEPFKEVDPQDPKNGVNNSKNVQRLSAVENIPLQHTSKKSTGKPRFFSRESQVPKDFTIPSNSNSDDETNDGRTGKSFRDVRRMGIDLVEEVREKSREMRAWTASKLPQLQR